MTVVHCNVKEVGMPGRIETMKLIERNTSGHWNGEKLFGYDLKIISNGIKKWLHGVTWNSKASGQEKIY